jgi:hypothetical protein
MEKPMPVLLLARGDKEGRDLLRKALEARYGLSVPAIETLRVDFDGRVRTKLGPISAWMPFKTTIYFRFPDEARWDLNVRMMGILLRSRTNTYDGTVYRKRRHSDEIKAISDPKTVRAARLRIMTAGGMLLTPLAQEFIKLKAIGERRFEATNTETHDTISVSLHEDFTVDTVSTNCPNPYQGYEEQHFAYQALEGLTTINDMMLPRKILRLWNNVVEHEIVPKVVETNPTLDHSIFTLENEAQQ